MAQIADRNNIDADATDPQFLPDGSLIRL